MCILLNVKKHEKTFALNVDIFNQCLFCAKCLTVQLVHIYNGKKKPDDKKEVENEK